MRNVANLSFELKLLANGVSLFSCISQVANMHQREAAKVSLRQYDMGNRFDSSVLPKASVLVPLFEKNGALHTLMTLRSKEVNVLNALRNIDA